MNKCFSHFDIIKKLVSFFEKLSIWHLNVSYLQSSMFQQRQARAVVNGERSRVISMSNMVYQGTVWGPPFWNTFFSDSQQALTALAFTGIFYADNLNAFKAFAATASDRSILDELRAARYELHTWGLANQVTFDAGKESFHILSRSCPNGEEFKILGITFGCKLLMHTTIDDCVSTCGWKLECICRTRRFFSDADLVFFYKAHLLSYIEYRTPGIHHAAPSALKALDAIQQRLLRQTGLSETDALVHFNLAPPSTRRDIAMLGIIHRTLLVAKGPRIFADFSVYRIDPVRGTQGQDTPNKWRIFATIRAAQIIFCSKRLG